MTCTDATPPPPPEPEDTSGTNEVSANDTPSTGMDPGAIAGITIGLFFGMVIIGMLVYYRYGYMEANPKIKQGVMFTGVKLSPQW